MKAPFDDFLFGCATSAYQIEGGIANDWTACRDAGSATDHWRLFAKDYALLTDLGANAYRMSIEWARVEPEPGAYDPNALAQYSRMVDGLLERGIEPFVTLLHFTHPRWFHARCPWHGSSESVDRFGAFVAAVAAVLADRVRFWTVLNEPMVWLAGAHFAGAIPPHAKGLRNLGRAFFNLVRAHASAFAILKARAGQHVGIANNMVHFEPSRRLSPLDRAAAAYVGDQFNHAFLRAAVHTLDFIGVNYYSRVFTQISPFGRASFFYEDRSGRGVSDLGWENFPEGLFHVLLATGRYGLPVYITENGLDDRDDSRRAAFLFDHLEAVAQARRAGVDIRGYFHWSLLDNFEWLEGFGPRFGLYRVDYETLGRTPTRAALLFSQIARERRLPPERPIERRRPGRGRTPAGGGRARHSDS